MPTEGTREAKIRERFETWAKTCGWVQGPFDREEDGEEYESNALQLEWEGWQAGREQGLEEAALKCDEHWNYAGSQMAHENCQTDVCHGADAKAIRSLSSRKAGSDG